MQSEVYKVRLVDGHELICYLEAKGDKFKLTYPFSIMMIQPGKLGMNFYIDMKQMKDGIEIKCDHTLTYYKAKDEDMIKSFEKHVSKVKELASGLVLPGNNNLK